MLRPIKWAPPDIARGHGKNQSTVHSNPQWMHSLKIGAKYYGALDVPAPGSKVFIYGYIFHGQKWGKKWSIFEKWGMRKWGILKNGA